MPQSSSSTLGLRWRWLVPAAALVVAFHFSPFGVALDRAFFDFASRHPARAKPVPPGSAIVLVDEATLAVVGREPFNMRWPFSRLTFAGMIAALERAGARKIIVDFTFFEQSGRLEHDLLLAAVAAAVPNVVLARTEKQPPVFWDAEFTKENPALFTKPRAGDVTLLSDEDGVSRRYEVPGSLASLAFDPPATLTGGLLRWHGGLRTLASHPEVPVISAARFVVRGEEIGRRLMAASPDVDVPQVVRALAAEPSLANDPAFSAVRGRTVFLGANASGAFDVKGTPVGRVEPGTLIHWTAWANLSGSGFITPVHRGLALLLAGIVGFSILGISTVRPGVFIPGLVAIGVTAAVLVTSYAGMSADWFLPPATTTATALLTFLGVAVENFWAEQQRKREIQAMFGSYVDPAVVARLVRDPHAIRLGGERVPATVYFSDLAGFTDLSEKIPPEELLEIINLYLQEMSDCLMGHGAYIDKYIGDAVMAVFGAPQPRPDHALAA